MRSDDNVQAVQSKTYNVVAGVTNAVYVAPETRQVVSMLNYVTGGSLLVFSVSTGATLAGPTLVSYFNSGSFFVLGTSLTRIEGPAGFYLAANNATTTISVMKGFSSPEGSVNS